MPDNLLTNIKNFFTKKTKVDTEPNSAIKDDLKGSDLKVAQNETADMQIGEHEKEITSEVNDITPPAKSHTIDEVKEEVIKVLKTCYDPEIPVDIWELGLVYDVKVAENHDVLIVMTLTSPSCPVAGILPGEVEQRVKEHPMVHDCKVQLTFDPPWNQRMMSEVAKLELGFL